MQPEFTIRIATPGDVGAIRRVHRQSIVELAARHYPAEVVAEWGTDESPVAVRAHRERLRDGNELAWVAVGGAQVLGFSALVPASGELRAVYVIGAWARRGVGRSLLLALENRARELGLPRLTLHSSIGAREFYAANGYADLGRAVHTMHSGRQMVCHVMEKKIV